ncbi:MAG: hypothetical protein EBU52_19285, partial [Cytophagia bacterium]|nr:hypothetical protein [Cytophagia bacterium]
RGSRAARRRQIKDDPQIDAVHNLADADVFRAVGEGLICGEVVRRDAGFPALERLVAPKRDGHITPPPCRRACLPSERRKTRSTPRARRSQPSAYR